MRSTAARERPLTSSRSSILPFLYQQIRFGINSTAIQGSAQEIHRFTAPHPFLDPERSCLLRHAGDLRTKQILARDEVLLNGSMGHRYDLFVLLHQSNIECTTTDHTVGANDRHPLSRFPCGLDALGYSRPTFNSNAPNGHVWCHIVIIHPIALAYKCCQPYSHTTPVPPSG